MIAYQSIGTALGMALFAWLMQTSLSGLDRKIIARIQKRRGPVWYQNFRDVFKLLNKRTITHGWIFDLGLLIALAGAIGTAMFMPVAGIIPFKGFDNFFMITYLAALGVFGRALSAGASGNPLAAIGVMRGLTQNIGYKLPYMVLVIVLISYYHTSSISGIVAIQQTAGWSVLKMPLGVLVAFISLHGMLGKKPFDTYLAPSEVASGPMVEFGGKYMALLNIAHEIAVFVEISLFVNLFLGGGANLAEFLLKYMAVYLSSSCLGAVMGRLRVEQVVRFFYKIPIGLTILQVLLFSLMYGGVS